VLLTGTAFLAAPSFENRQWVTLSDPSETQTHVLPGLSNAIASDSRSRLLSRLRPCSARSGFWVLSDRTEISFQVD